MDPITAAITAAIAAGVLGVVTDATKATITDGYNKLKDRLTKKLGTNSGVVKAIKNLEDEPGSDTVEKFQKEIAAAGIAQDREILETALRLQSLVPSPQGPSITGSPSKYQVNIQNTGGSNETNIDHIGDKIYYPPPPLFAPRHPLTSDDELMAYIQSLLPALLHTQFSPKNAAARSAVREQTLLILPRLNNNGKARVLRFLYNGRLIDAQQPIIDLEDADLSGANLARAQLSNAALRAVNLRNANLASANLQGSDLREAKLDEANLHVARLVSSDLSRAWLDHTNLEEAYLYKAKLCGIFAQNVKLILSDLTGADLTEAMLLETDLSFANMSDTNLKGAFLGRWKPAASNKRWPRRVDDRMPGSDLRGVNLSNAQISDANLVNVNLSKANLSNATLEDADLRGADLRWATIIGTNLRGADLRGVNLTGADIQNAPMSFILPLGTNEQQIEELAQDVGIVGAKRRAFVEDAMARGLNAHAHIISLKRLVAKLAAVGTIVTEKQLEAARFELTNSNSFVVPYWVPYWAGKDRPKTPESEVRSARVRQLAGYLADHGAQIENYDGATIQTSEVRILCMYESRPTASFMKELQFELDRSEQVDFPRWR